MNGDIQAYIDLLVILAILGTVIGIVFGFIAGFVKVGFQLAPYLAAGGLILLLIEFLK